MADKKYQVFISSTYSDLIEERRKILDILLMADCIPSGMEAFVATDSEQFEVIKKVIDLCDYYVLLIGKRYGSINPVTGLSYTEMEYDYAKSKDIPVLVFAIDESIDLPDCKIELDPYKVEALRLFRAKTMSNRLVSVWKTVDELTGKLAVSIMRAKEEISRPGWIRLSSNESPHKQRKKITKQVSSSITNEIQDIEQKQVKMETTILQGEKSESFNQGTLSSVSSNSEISKSISIPSFTKDQSKEETELENLRSITVSIEYSVSNNFDPNISVRSKVFNLLELLKIIVLEMSDSTIPTGKIVRTVKDLLLQPGSDATVHLFDIHFVEKLLAEFMTRGYLDMPFKNYWKLSTKGEAMLTLIKS